ncbi:regulator of ime2 [Conoideocrella luteorostrata]|uniref:Regulator of ime2 n=1 Tax=Conoideocrella luteorostrata TaxID=1105319 RepID=A0AAJ0CFI4_9HYPO|nr:regulator of ime2 [Conoideocrella luteorostrata]
MLRPATPLSALLFAAFVLLLLSVISIPVTKFVPLGENKDVKYGVFGYCQGDKCSKIGLGYPSGGILNDETQQFDLPSSVRHTLSAILVIHPVAAFLTLVMFCLAAAAHMHSSSHSARYLLVLFIFTLLTFVVCLVAFVVDVLLFIPHLAWGTYMVLASTIILAICAVVSCAMRRTIVGRKARQKRIAENAEMSGENYYNREGQMKPSPVIASQPAFPFVSGGNSGGGDHLPAFATFESQQKEDQVSDERNSLIQRSPVEKPNEMANMGDAASLAASRRSQSRDRYGNPLNAPPDAYGPQPYGRGRGGGQRGGRGGPNGRGGFDAYGVAGRGRGSGRGNYGPPGRGGPRGRAGYGPPPRGAYGPGGMRGGRGPPPVAGYGNMGPGQYDRRPSAEEFAPYGQPQASQTSLDRGWNGSINGSASGNHDLPRAESPPPLPGHAMTGTQAIEMDGGPLGPPNAFGHHNQLRDSDVDVAGMVGLQQNRAVAGGGRDTFMSEGSKYSQDEQYVPPRAAWNQGSGRNSPRAASPAHPYRPTPERAGQNIPAARTGSRGDYYEDTDPRFDGTPPQTAQGGQMQHQHLHPAHAEAEYEDVHASIGGSRSPAESERSNFTSISQRGVNPRWEPHPPMPNQGPPLRRPVQQKQQRQEVLLNNNPDFQLPGSRGQVPNRSGPGMIPGSAYPTGAI